VTDETKPEEIVKFDPNQFAKQLRDKIQFDIAMFLPEEVWLKKIEEEVAAFLEESSEIKPSYYNRDDRVIVPSGLTKVVYSIMEEKTQALTREYLATYKDWGSQVSSAVDDLIERNLAEIVRGVMGPVLQQAFNNINV